MRTRLDQIVEERQRFNSEYCVEDLNWVAERAFRHGVEQHIGYMRGDLATEVASRVQPAPAAPEEPTAAEKVGKAQEFMDAFCDEPAPAEECKRTVRSAREAARYMELGLCPRCGERHAPAEEKVTTDVRTYPPCAVCGGAAALDVHYGHAYDPAASPFTSGAFNRRKGQRRNDANEAMNYVHAYGLLSQPLPSRPIFQMCEHGAWYYDRRSGNERRKP